MRIVRLEATHISIPIQPPPFLAKPDRWSLIVVELETDTGITGYGMTASATPQSLVAFVNVQARGLLLGEDPLRHERIWQRLQHAFNRNEQSGLWVYGTSAIDMAVWDVKGKDGGVPVVQLLGGLRDQVDCYTTFGLDTYDVAGLVQAAGYWVKDGSSRLKLKVGGGLTHDEDIERVAAVRAAVGPKVALMIDANKSLSFHQALRLSRALERFDITWFEEPLPANDPLLLADLRAQTGIPLAAAQHESPRERFRNLIHGHAVDILQFNVANSGGITECLKIASLADSYRIPVSSAGGWSFHNAHLIAAVPNGLSVEMLQPHLAMYEAVCDGVPDFHGDVLVLPDRPGFGLAPKAGVLTEYRVNA